MAAFLTTSLLVTALMAKLRASEARFRTFADYATDGFFLIDDHSAILDVNHQACVGLGYSREELIGGIEAISMLVLTIRPSST